MAWTMCSSGAMEFKAGVNASLTVLSGAHMQSFNEQAESFINTATRINYTDAYDSLNDDVKKILEDAVSAKGAMMIINADMSGYTSRAEAQTMLDVNYTVLTDAIKLLSDKKYTDFIDGE